MNASLSRALPIAFILLVVIGLAGKFIAPQDPSEVDLTLRFIPPFHDLHHLLGTDQLGRDILSRTLTGASLSLLFHTWAWQFMHSEAGGRPALAPFSTVWWQ